MVYLFKKKKKIFSRLIKISYSIFLRAGVSLVTRTTQGGSTQMDHSGCPDSRSRLQYAVLDPFITLLSFRQCTLHAKKQFINTCHWKMLTLLSGSYRLVVNPSTWVSPVWYELLQTSKLCHCFGFGFFLFVLFLFAVVFNEFLDLPWNSILLPFRNLSKTGKPWIKSKMTTVQGLIKQLLFLETGVQREKKTTPTEIWTCHEIVSLLFIQLQHNQNIYTAFMRIQTPGL